MNPRLPALLAAAALAAATWTSHAQITDVAITPTGGPKRLSLRGAHGMEHILQSTTTPGTPGSWTDLLTFTVTNTADHGWFDSASQIVPRRFYRLVRPGAPRAPFYAPDLNLVDHLDRSQPLLYPSHKRAVVLILIGTTCTNSAASVPSIKALRDRFGPQGVVFHLVGADNTPSRTNLFHWATNHTVDLPVLHDPGLLAARALGAVATTECFAFSTTNWTQFYRGALDDRLDFNQPPTGFTQSYLSNALAQFIAGQTVTPSRTPAQGCAVEPPAFANISYATNIAPILQSKCVRCHTPGNIGTFAMTNYSVVSNLAASIRYEVLSRRMPPWHADPQYGSFTNDTSLTADQLNTLVQWLNGGAPRGSGPDPLADNPPAPVPDWPLGTPDAIVRIPLQSIPATGPIAYRYFDVPTPFTTNVWLRAAVVRPINRRVVHHVLVYFGTNSTLMGLDGFFAGYVPGAEQVPYPEGTGKLVPSGTLFRFQMHYTATGETESDQTELGLYLSPAPPAAELQTKSAFDALSFLGGFFYSIPPGAADHPAITAQLTPSTTKDVLLYELSPHMHFRGSRFKYEAVYPDNSREVLLNVPRYDFEWQTLYRLTTPKRLPAGTRIVCTGAFDNSPQNRRNPNPAVTVTFGEQTNDEMFIGYVNYSILP